RLHQVAPSEHRTTALGRQVPRQGQQRPGVTESAAQLPSEQDHTFAAFRGLDHDRFSPHGNHNRAILLLRPERSALKAPRITRIKDKKFNSLGTTNRKHFTAENAENAEKEKHFTTEDTENTEKEKMPLFFPCFPCLPW